MTQRERGTMVTILERDALLTPDPTRRVREATTDIVTTPVDFLEGLRAMVDQGATRERVLNITARLFDTMVGAKRYDEAQEERAFHNKLRRRAEAV